MKLNIKNFLMCNVSIIKDIFNYDKNYIYGGNTNEWKNVWN